MTLGIRSSQSWARTKVLRGVMLISLLGLAFTSSCFDSESVECENGLVCPVGAKCSGDNSVCITSDCGDGVMNAGEVCDDGNIANGDGCSADCSSVEQCGNLVVDMSADEVCDDGNNVDGDGCSADCLSSELCNNSIVDTAAGEVCDDGNNDDGDGCSADCLSDETCPNGVPDPAVGEVCDDGNSDDGDGCSADCFSDESCGNSIVDLAVGETCDDGNNDNGDGCSADCKSDETCGNDVVDPVAGEVCDDGNNDNGDGCSADCKSGEQCGNGSVDLNEQCDNLGNVDSATCDMDCTLRICGDSYTNTAGSEDCDTGGESPTCDVNCTVVECGDGTVNVSAGEQCDNVGPVDSATCDMNCSFAVCGDNYTNAAAGEQCDTAGSSVACNSNCTLASCGDGILNLARNEQCDDGGQSATCDTDCTIAFCGDAQLNLTRNEQCDDGAETTNCNANCTNAACGDGVLNLARGEQCDVLGGGNTSLCDANCTIAFCGDGTVNAAAGEACDNLGGGSTASCDSNCTAVMCGDGTVNAAANEQCDNLGAVNSMTCDSDCTSAFCGDSFLNTAAGETCDTGGETFNCNANCTVASCGDGVVNITRGEQCDANAVDSATCDSDCSIAICGDGYVNNAAGEQCDDMNQDNNDACRNNCTTGSCGDGFLSPDEVCDDGNTTTETACPYGTQSCTNFCNATCTAQLTLAGPYCGDGAQTNGEACDDGNSVNETECPYGISMCTGCSNTCQVIPDLVGGTCGNGMIDTGEMCDDGNGLSCGTCDATCDNSQTGAATAVINATSGVVDGETITLNDGLNSPLTFEFDTSVTPAIVPGRVRINISGGASANNVRDAIIAAVNGVTGANDQLRMTAAIISGSGNLRLTHDLQTGLGNQSQSDTVADSNFAVANMTGGFSNDCEAATSCEVNADCAGTCVAGSCSAVTYKVGGRVAGLSGTGLTLLNGGVPLPVSANGAFTFAAALATGASYNVTVQTNPTGPAQTCSVSNGGGTVASVNVTNVVISCVTQTFNVGGTISGLASGNDVVLQNNGAGSITRGNGSYSFAVSDGANYSITVLTQPTTPNQTCAVSNPTGTVNGSAITNVNITCVTTKYTVGGTVTGLTGSGLKLENNNTDEETITADGSYTFDTALDDGSAFAVTVSVQPSGPTQTCTVSNGSGNLNGSNVTNANINCSTSSFTVGGSVTGLASGNSVSLKNNGGTDLVVSSNTTFAFPSQADGSAYAVTVSVQPTTPNQTCTVTNGSGNVSGSNVTDVAVACTTTTYTVGGSVSGLTGAGLVLQNNLGNNQSVAAMATSHEFSTAIADGAGYLVTVQTQPAGQFCSVANASGTITGANVTDTNVSCVNTYTIGGSITGLTASGLVLQNNGGGNLSVAMSATDFTFATPVPDGGAYAVTVMTQPTGLTCTVGAGSGNVASANITTVTLTCAP